MSFVKNFNGKACKKAIKLVVNELLPNEEIRDAGAVYLGQTAGVNEAGVQVVIRNVITGYERSIIYKYSELTKDRRRSSIRKCD